LRPHLAQRQAISQNATTVVEPGWRAELTDLDHMLLRRSEPRATQTAPGKDVLSKGDWLLDAVRLSRARRKLRR
jgi:hypothetical protein